MLAREAQIIPDVLFESLWNSLSRQQSSLFSGFGCWVDGKKERYLFSRIILPTKTVSFTPIFLESALDDLGSLTYPGRTSA